MSDEVSFSLHGTDAFGKALDKMIAEASIAAKEFVTAGALIIEAASKSHMDARPGPLVQTGTLRRSVNVLEVTDLGAGEWESRTGPTAIYGRRIELGFHQTDRLGRVYNQPAYPFMGPGLETARSRLEALAADSFGAITSRR